MLKSIKIIKKFLGKIEKFLQNKEILIWGVGLPIIVLGISVFHEFRDKDLTAENLQNFFSPSSRTESPMEMTSLQISVKKEIPSPSPSPTSTPFPRPAVVKAVYLTSWSAGTREKLEEVMKTIKTTEINAVIVDIKDYSGLISYDTDVAEALKYNTERITIPDTKAFLGKFHKEGIYVIARIAVFQDPALAQARPDLAIHKKSDKSSPWLDNLGLAWVDPSSKEVWDYNILIARDALTQGFDEINFDYVRFPSDGNLRNLDFPFWNGITPKDSVLRKFFKYLREQLPQAVLSVDFFGYSTVNSDNLNIGQIIEDAFEYFDYICPMVYPSHYDSGFLGYQNPAQHPYEVIKHSLDSALKRLIDFNELGQNKAKLRPWLQDFTLGGVIYDEKMVKAEIQAVYDALGENFSGFMLWNPKNI